MKENEVADLDARLKAAGMYSVTELMAGTPVDKWRVHAGMDNLQFFGEWLERKAREYKAMAARYEIGDKDKADELYEWVFAHSGVFHEVLVNFRAANAAPELSDPIGQKLSKNAIEAARTAFNDMFAHCLSNGVYNAWGKGMNCTSINTARQLIDSALSAEPAQGVYAPADELRDLRQSILQSKTLADFNAVKKTVKALTAPTTEAGK